MAMIEIEGLRKEYRRLRGGHTVAVAGLDLSVPEGGVFGFLGPNGAGKTTTIRCLLGLVRPSAGRLSLLGADVGHALPSVIGRVGSIVEAPAMFPRFTGRRNLEILARIHGEGDAAIDASLERVGLRDRAKDPVRTYSLGMKQRLAIAATLLRDPSLLILDEPANGLDPAGIVEVRELLRSLGAEGRTVFVSSHILSEIQQMADVVGIIGRGRLIREGTVESLLREEGSIRIRVGADEVATAAGILLKAAGPGAVTPEDGPEAGWLAVRVDPGRSSELNRALAGAGVFASRIEGAANLESLFLELTGTQSDIGGGPPGGKGGKVEVEAVDWSGGSGTPSGTTGSPS
jgi:ABC-2 type transport system ATP-binding protein